MKKTMNYKRVVFKTANHPDHRFGSLTFAEQDSDIPFSIKRIYWIYDTDEGITRGAHAHKKTWQLLFCPFGSLSIDLNDGENTEQVVLDDPSKGLILPPEIWHDMTWNIKGSVLCVAASDKYDPDDYLRDYDEYLEYYKGRV